MLEVPGSGVSRWAPLFARFITSSLSLHALTSLFNSLTSPLNRANSGAAPNVPCTFWLWTWFSSSPNFLLLSSICFSNSEYDFWRSRSMVRTRVLKDVMMDSMCLTAKSRVLEKAGSMFDTTSNVATCPFMRLF